MKHFLTVVIVGTMLFTGCALKQEAFDTAEARLETLTDKGLPDSLISPAKVAFVDAQGKMKRNRKSEAKTALKRAIAAMDKADSVLESSLSVKKPEMLAWYERSKKSADESLKGLHLKSADSALAHIDSLLAISFVFKAERLLATFDAHLVKLKEQQKIADETRKKVIGTWKFEEVTTSTVDPTVRAVEKKIFTFNKNGTSKFVEQKKGKSSPSLKEDWLFETYGTWDMMGDTVHVLGNRFATRRQIFWEQNPQNEKKWIKKAHPVYDSTITDGSQNRYISYKQLLEDFTRTAR